MNALAYLILISLICFTSSMHHVKILLINYVCARMLGVTNLAVCLECYRPKCGLGAITGCYQQFFY